MSPEQATGDRVSTPGATCTRSARMLYEMLAGEPPHTGATSANRAPAKPMTEWPTPLRVIRDTVPVAVEAAVARALAKNTVRPVRDRRRAHQGPGLATESRPTSDHPPAPHRNRGGRSGLRRSRGRVCLGRARPGTVGRRLIRLAVLPFESIGDSSDPTFGDGMSEAILELAWRGFLA